MAWFFLVIAGLGEIIGVMGINKINQNRNWNSILVLFGGFIVSFVFLTIAMETIQMSTAYAVWTGMGTVGSALIGIIVYKESADWRRVLFIGMILSAVVGLKLIG